MTETSIKNSRTEFVIALDEDDSDEDNKEVPNNSKDIYESVSQTLAQVLDTIESMPMVEEVNDNVTVEVVEDNVTIEEVDDNMTVEGVEDNVTIVEVDDNATVDPSECLPTASQIKEIFRNANQLEISQNDTEVPQIEEVESGVEDDDDIEEITDEPNLTRESVEPFFAKRMVRPVDDLEDIENMEVNILNARDDALSDDMDDDDLEAEDCMIIEALAYEYDRNRDAIDEHINPIVDEDDDIEIIESTNDNNNTTNQLPETASTSEKPSTRDESIIEDEDLVDESPRQQPIENQDVAQEVINLSDDEEECVIIDDSFSIEV